jgi:pimeloyl-ACP methyl ester carboxylesterase
MVVRVPRHWSLQLQQQQIVCGCNTPRSLTTQAVVAMQHSCIATTGRLPKPRRKRIMPERILLPDRSWLGYHTQGSGPRHVLLLHGFAANRGTWFDLAPLFPSDQYTLHLLDLPAHGTASRSTSHNYSILAQAERIRTFLTLHKLNNIDLAGHSLGGAVALTTAIREHEDNTCRIQRLILIGALPIQCRCPALSSYYHGVSWGPLCLGLIAPATIARKGLEAVFVNHRLITPERIQRYATTFCRYGTARALSKCARQLVPQNLPELVSSYHRLTIPTLCFGGNMTGWCRHPTVCSLHRIYPLPPVSYCRTVAIIPMRKSRISQWK